MTAHITKKNRAQSDTLTRPSTHPTNCLPPAHLNHSSFFRWKNLRRYISWNTADATHTAREKMLNQATLVLVSSARAQEKARQKTGRTSRAKLAIVVTAAQPGTPTAYALFAVILPVQNNCQHCRPAQPPLLLPPPLPLHTHSPLRSRISCSRCCSCSISA